MKHFSLQTDIFKEAVVFDAANTPRQQIDDLSVKHIHNKKADSFCSELRRIKDISEHLFSSKQTSSIPQAMALAIALSVSCCTDVKNKKKDFSDDFLFGVAISGFQNEPGCPSMPENICVDPNSDWAAFVSDPSIQQNPLLFVQGDPLSDGPGFWELYDQDLARAEKLHLTTFRTSLEWSRIFPTTTEGVEGYENLKEIANQEAIDHYHQILDSMKVHGLKPFITINHYTLPLWIHDGVACHNDLSSCPAKGWLDEKTIVTEIGKFAGFVAREFGNEVDRWSTLNEPMAVVISSFLAQSPERSNPPALPFHIDEAKKSMQNMIAANAAMYDAVKEEDSFDADGDGLASEVGLIYAIAPVRPIDPASKLDQQGAKNLSYLYNDSFLKAITKGFMDPDLDGNATFVPEMAGKADFIGVNYYYSLGIKGSETPLLPDLSPLTTFDVPSLIFHFDKIVQNDPKGMYEAIMKVRDLGLPCYVTENGMVIPEDGKDPHNQTSKFIVQNLESVSKAIQDGANVKGYYFWTLTDNYEWNRGMNDIRMGLFAVDKDDPFKVRKEREKITFTYGTIANNHTIPFAFKVKYGD